MMSKFIYFCNLYLVARSSLAHVQTVVPRLSFPSLGRIKLFLVFYISWLEFPVMGGWCILNYIHGLEAVVDYAQVLSQPQTK